MSNTLRERTMEPAEHLIVTPDDLGRFCAQLKETPRFGLDTEFVGEESYHPRLCLVQIATPEGLYLIDPFTTGPLDEFWRIVTDPSHQVVVHAGREEVRLCNLWSGFAPGRLFDLQIAAGLVGYTYPLGHAALVLQLLGQRMSKNETLTEWRTRPLTPAQIQYAFDDVRYLLPITEELTRRLEDLQRTAWAEEEFKRLCDLATPEEPGLAPGTNKWRKLRGAGSLERRRLAILRALYNWREQEAAHVNRPARTIIRDDLLVEIARRNPKNERDLGHVRGLAKRYITALLQAVEEARSLPQEQWPALADKEIDQPQVTWIVNILTGTLADYCARHHLAGSLVSSNSDVRALVRARMLNKPFPEDNILMQGWRAEFVLPHLEAILNGSRAVRIQNLHADAPFAYRDEAPPSVEVSRPNDTD